MTTGRGSMTFVHIGQKTPANSVGAVSIRRTKGIVMPQETQPTDVATRPNELLDELRESAKTGQHAVASALRELRQAVDEAVPEAVQPLRTKIVDAAVEFAERLVAAQYQFNRNLIRSADRALAGSHDTKD